MPSTPITLLPHPAALPTAGEQAFRVSVRVQPDKATGLLRLHYQISGALDRIALPLASIPLDPDRLWAHTCCEAFLMRQAPAYCEYNFSPSGQTATYAFSAYRERCDGQASAPPTIWQERHHDRFDLVANVPVAHTGAPAELALSVVIEEKSGQLSYWALRHPSDRPDFHHPHSFSLLITL